VAAIGVVWLRTNVYVIQSVTVEGDMGAYTPAEVVACCGVHSGQSVFYVDQLKIAQALSQQLHLELDAVEVKYPNKLILSVHPRAPRAALSILGMLLMVDKDGLVLEASSQLDTRLQIPVVTGMEDVAWNMGRTVIPKDEAQLQAVHDVLNELELQLVITRASELNVAKLDNLYLITREGMKVELGDRSDMERKIGLMRAVLAELAKASVYTGSLDVSSGTVADYQEMQIFNYEYVPEPTAVPNEMVRR
jgi:cell division septal protein FtsQ